MKGSDLKAFRKANGLTQSALGEYLGINKSFISTIESGKDPMPREKLSKLLHNNKGWDTSMIQVGARGISLIDVSGRHGGYQPNLSSVVKDVLTPKQDALHTGYLQRKVEDQEKLIRELYQKIGMLEAKLELATKGDNSVPEEA